MGALARAAFILLTLTISSIVLADPPNTTLESSAAITTNGAGRQVMGLIRAAVVAHEVAYSYDEWHESALAPEGVAQTLREWAQGPGFTDQFCAAVERLPTVDLYYLLDFLEAPPYSIPCAAEALGRYNMFIQSEQVRLAYPGPGRGELDYESMRPHSAFAPTKEIILDATARPLIIDGDLPKGTLVLTFDDGPHPTRTQELLAILKGAGIKAQFFLVGRNSVLYPDTIRRIASEGHEIGCHSFTHPDMRKLSFADATKEIEDGFSAITKALGEPRSFFRFPYGANTVALRKYLLDTKTPEFFWNIDTLDWKYKDPSVLLKYALEQVDAEGRGVVLFHDIQPQTIAIMPAFLDALKARNMNLAIFRPVTPRL